MNLDLLLPAALVAGIAGSGHCIGMCGPIVVLFESAPPANLGHLPRRLLYNAGRLASYVLLGAVAGAAGLVLTRIAGVETGLSLLRWLAALMVVLLGLNLLTSWRSLAVFEQGGAALWRRLAPLARRILPVDRPTRAIGAGFVWGFLPCGLVYSAAALAAAAGNAASGALVMLLFWLGTLPALLLAGTSAARLAALTKRPPIRRLSGALLILLGLFALAAHHAFPGHTDAAGDHAGHVQPAA